MGKAHDEMVAYLPACLLCAAAEQPARSLPWCDEVEGTMVMADLSGFTALSERLAALGNEGAERLTGIINSFFDRMLRTAAGYGGDTLTFGGDAILLLFTGPDHAPRAVAAAQAMLRRVGRAGAVDAGGGKVKIGMSVGAHSGALLLAAAGLPEERAHLTVIGRGAEQTARAEAQADRGELAVSTAMKALLPEDSVLSPTGDFWRVDEVVAQSTQRLPDDGVPVSRARLLSLEPFLPPYARDGSGPRAGRVQHAPEHRRTVIVFVDVLGLSEIIESAGIEAALAQWQAYSAMLTRLAAKYQGFVVSSDIATEGSKLVVTFGTPVAHEYAPANAARFALELRGGLQQAGLDIRHKIGLNGGHVFAGELGPSFRRQYTVMGDAVNLAARLMSAADPGEAVINSNLLADIGPDLCARELEPIKVKGKEKPVGVCVLEKEGRTAGQVRGGAEQRRRGRLFGRQRELEAISERWQRARAGAGCTVLIEGEPGVGKTRLLEEALRWARADEPRVLRAACFEHLQAAPFTPWADLLEQAMSLPNAESAARRTRRVQDFLVVHLPELAELGALLNPLLTLSLPRSDVVGSLEGELRRQRLFDLMAAILRSECDDDSSIIVIEDLHWMDESSLAFAQDIAARIAASPVLLVLTSRPVDSQLGLVATEIERVPLAELSEDESLAMVEEALGLTTLPHDVGDAIYAKSKGNPLFLEEVVFSLRRSGALDRILAASAVTRAAELAALEIPDRVQGLLMSRIDRLLPDAREVLKVGSIIGRTFDRRMLQGIDDELLRSVGVARSLRELLESELVVPSEDDETVTFRHALLQDVAYESIPFARRREVHGRVGRFLEMEQVEAPDHALLVHHFRHAGDDPRTRVHAVRASERSVAVYANSEAIDYLAIASDTARAPTPHDACLRSRFDELTGDAMAALARHDEAIGCYARARRRWASPRVRRLAQDALRELAPLTDADAREALLCWKIAVALERGRSLYRQCLSWLAKAERTLPPGHRDAEARMLTTKGVVLSRMGRYQEAEEAGRRGVDLAREEGDPGLQAFALNMLGSLLGTLGILDRAIACSSEAASLYEQSGDLYGEAVCHGNVGADQTLSGDFSSAHEHLEKSLALHHRIGNVNGIAFQHLNLGGLLSQMGRLPDAIGHLEEAIGLRDRQGVSLLATGFTYVLLARALVWSGDLGPARRALDEAFRILESINAQSILLDASIIESEWCLAAGELERAEVVCAKVVADSIAMNAEYSEGEARTMLGRVLIALDREDEAVPSLEASVSLATKAGSDYERAKALAVLAEAKSACTFDDAECAAALDEAIALFEEMGARYDLQKALDLRGALGLSAANATERHHGDAYGA